LDMFGFAWRGMHGKHVSEDDSKPGGF